MRYDALLSRQHMRPRQRTSPYMPVRKKVTDGVTHGFCCDAMLPASSGPGPQCLERGGRSGAGMSSNQPLWVLLSRRGGGMLLHESSRRADKTRMGARARSTSTVGRSGGRVEISMIVAVSEYRGMPGGWWRRGLGSGRARGRCWRRRTWFCLGGGGCSARAMGGTVSGGGGGEVSVS